jgi:hypothetical protein
MKTSLLSAVPVLLLVASLAPAQNTTGTTQLSVSIGAEAALSVTNSTTLASTGTTFAAFAGSTTLTYYVRTVASGSVTAQVTSDFSPAGGPSVATPPTAGDKLTYNCAMNQPGKNGSVTNCTANMQALTTSATNVATFGPDARSISAGNTGSVNWTLSNDPAYKAGSYSATVTFTISTT